MVMVPASALLLSLSLRLPSFKWNCSVMSCQFGLSAEGLLSSLGGAELGVACSLDAVSSVLLPVSVLSSAVSESVVALACASLSARVCLSASASASVFAAVSSFACASAVVCVYVSMDG